MGEKWVRVANLSELPTEGLGHSVKAEGLDIALTVSLRRNTAGAPASLNPSPATVARLP